MAINGCADCQLRGKYDNNPKSFAGRFWKWHIKYCPGWKNYIKSLDKEEQDKVRAQYKLSK